MKITIEYENGKAGTMNLTSWETGVVIGVFVSGCWIISCGFGILIDTILTVS